MLLCLAGHLFRAPAGYDVIHSAISILLNYLLLVTLGGSRFSVVLSFTFNMAYLLIAYVLLSTDGYDLIWTTPHCVLTLKMTGTAFDLYDGRKKEESLSLEQKRMNIKSAPSLLELAGYAYFIGGCFAAPLFAIRTYLDLTAGKLTDNDRGEPPNCVMPALNRFALACAYLVFYTTCSPFFPNVYLMSSEFANSSLPYQIMMLVCWGKIVIAKYSVIFLLTEGVCIMSGLTYNGRDKTGNALWDGCASMKPMVAELATTSAELVQSYNITTNLWVSRYVYKRLKFLNNRYISQSAALFFLAIFHGVYVGYFIGFAMEFFVFRIENRVMDAGKRSPTLARIANNTLVKIILFAVFKVWNWFILSYGIVAIVLLRWRRIRLVFEAMYYAPLCFYVAFPLFFDYIILPQLKKTERNVKDATKSQDAETSKTK